MSDENVIEFPGVPGEVSVVMRGEKNSGGGPCRHRFRKKLVDRNSRTVTCEGCSAAIDAFDVLMEIADHREGQRQSIDALGRELDRQSAKLEQAKAEERRAKARTRNARRKDAVIEERRRILDLIDTAMQNFMEWEARHAERDRAEGILRGFSEVVRGLFDETEIGSNAREVCLRIDAAHDELRSRRRRRGEHRKQRGRGAGD